MMHCFRAVAMTLVLLASVIHAGAAKTPGAPARSNASNFKDMVLAICIARTQQGPTAADADAASSARALVEWTVYDAEEGPDKIDRIVNHFLRRDYRNPLGDDTPDGTQFNLLKCLDLYHSPELASLAKRLVLKPDRRNR